MRTRLAVRRLAKPASLSAVLGFASLLMGQSPPASEAGGEASLHLPDLSQVSFVGGVNGHTLLLVGLAFCAAGLLFGLTIYTQLKNLPVHRSMREISELIYETCKTYLVTQGKFILILWAFIAVIIAAYFRLACPGSREVHCRHPADHSRLQPGGYCRQLRRGLVRHSREHLRQLAHRVCRPARQALPCATTIPLKAGMSIGMMLISVELLIMLCILLFIPGDYAGPCFIGFAIGESLGAAALRIAGGIFTKIADIGSDLMKIVFKIKEDDARNPGVIADCTGDNAGDSVGPSADGFETYGVTGVALITFILLGVHEPQRTGTVAGVDLRHARHDAGRQRGFLLPEPCRRQGQVCTSDQMDFEAPLTSLVWLTSIVSIALTYVVSYVMIPVARRRFDSVVEAGHHHQLRHPGGRGDSGAGKGLHFDLDRARARGCYLVARGRRFAEHPLRLCRRQFLRLLTWAGDGRS